MAVPTKPELTTFADIFAKDLDGRRASWTPAVGFVSPTEREKKEMWWAVEKNLTYLASKDTKTTWYDDTGAEIDLGSFPHNYTIVQHITHTHKKNPYYVPCQFIIEQTKYALYTHVRITGTTYVGGKSNQVGPGYCTGNWKHFATAPTDKTICKDNGGTWVDGWDPDDLKYDNRFETGKAEAHWGAGDLGTLKRYSDTEFQQHFWDKSNAYTYAQAMYQQLIKCKNIADKLYTDQLPPQDSRASKSATGDLAAAIKAALAAATAPPPKPVVTPPDTTKSLGFREQCFVLSRILDLADWRIQEVDRQEPKPLPYAGGFDFNACTMVQGDPFQFMSRLAIYPTQATFLNMETAEVANLQPQMRFFKVQQDKENEEVVTEIDFGTHVNAGDIADLAQSNGRKRGYGVGIESFNVKLIGTSVYSAKRDLTAQLTIFANNVSDLLKMRGPPGGEYRYIDLALHTTATQADIARFKPLSSKNHGSGIESLADLTFKIRAIVGVMPPVNAVSNPNVKMAISTNQMTLEMKPTDYEFNFKDDGTLQFVINYKPWINEHYSGLTYDIFNNETNNEFMLEKKLEEAMLSADCNTEALSEYRKIVLAQAKKIRQLATQSIVSRLHRYGKLRYIYLSTAFLNKLKTQGPGISLEEIDAERMKIKQPSKISKLQKRLLAETHEEKPRLTSAEARIGQEAISPKQSELVFFYLSDLIDIIMLGTDERLDPQNFIARLNKVEESIKKKRLANTRVRQIPANIKSEQINLNKKEYNNYKQLRVVLGPIELVDPLDASKVKIVNLGDIPVSLKYFMEFLTAETLQKNLFSYSLSDFLDKLISKMLSAFLNDDTCFGGMVKQKTTLKHTTIHATNRSPHTKDPGGMPHTDDLTKWTLNQRYEWLRAQPTSGDKEPTYTSRLYPEIGEAKNWRPLLEPAPGIVRSNNPTYGSYNYLIFYTDRVEPAELYTGDWASDTARGIHHYATSRDRGIIKSIGLTRNTPPHLREMRHAEEGYDPLRQMRHVYNIEVKTFANYGVFCGQTIYLDPQGWVPYLDKDTSERFGGIKGLTELGIGGYYSVYDAEHSFGPGQFESVFNAQWTGQAMEGLEPTTQHSLEQEQRQAWLTGGSPETPSSSKCKTRPAPKGSQSPEPQTEEMAAKVVAARQQALAESLYPPGASVDKNGKLVAGNPKPEDNPHPQIPQNIDLSPEPPPPNQSVEPPDPFEHMRNEIARQQSLIMDSP